MMRFLPRRRIDREWKSSGIGQTVTKVTVTGQWAGSNASPSVGQPLYVALYNIIMNPIVTVCCMPVQDIRRPKRDTKEPPYCEGGCGTDDLTWQGIRSDRVYFASDWIALVLLLLLLFSALSAKGVDIAKKDNGNQCWRVSEMMFYSRKVLLKVPSESQLVLRWDECRSFHVPKSDDQVAVNCVFLWSWRIPRDFDNDRSSSIKAEAEEMRRWRQLAHTILIYPRPVP